jgi:hypothetical protein
MTPRPKKRVDWRKRFGSSKTPHVVTLQADFAGVKAGSTLLISSPGDIAAYLAAIPRGEVRAIARMRSDLAKRAMADAMCPVTTAIYLRVVAEAALADLADGKRTDEVAPFWRVIAPDSKIAAKLSCGSEGVQHWAQLDASELNEPT